MGTMFVTRAKKRAQNMSRAWFDMTIHCARDMLYRYTLSPKLNGSLGEMKLLVFYRKDLAPHIGAQELNTQTTGTPYLDRPHLRNMMCKHMRT